MHERNSINARGMKLDSTVHYGEDYNNAFGMEKKWVMVLETERYSSGSQVH